MRREYSFINYQQQNQITFFPQWLTTLKFRQKVAFAIFAAMKREQDGLDRDRNIKKSS
jgi:hypothetical protein